MEQLLTHSCPNIKSQTKVEILHVHDFPATTIDYWVNLRDTYNKQCNANLGSKGLSPKYFVAKFIDNTDVMLESACKSIHTVQEFIDKNYAEHESDIEIISIEIKQHQSYKVI